MTPGKEKARGNGQVTTGPESSTDGRKHSTSAAAIKPRFDLRQTRAEDAGRQLLYSWCEHGRHAANDFPPDCFPSITLRTIAERLALITGGEVIGWQDAMPLFPEDHLRTAFIECTEGVFPATPEHCRPLVDMLRTFHSERRTREIAEKISKALDQGDEIDGLLAELAKIKGTPTASIADMLAARVFDFTAQPPRPIPRFMLADKPLCTPGNITNIQAPPKAGKSAVVDAMLASVMNGNRQGPDTLSFSAENPYGFALIHLDTEQSRYDADALVRRAIRRANLTEPPSWFYSYSVADLGIRERRDALRHVMGEAGKDHGGIFAVMIDGVGDLCADPNDSEEAFDLVHELHALAITHDCAIATVLHENPGSESGKTRGHLGSQLERKAETNLRLAKCKDGITTVWAERARHCYLPREQGPCFTWNDERKMHISCGTSGEIKQAASRERFQGEAETAFGDADALRHADLLNACCEAFDIKERAAKDRVRKWAAEGIIRKNAAGKYQLTTP